MKNNKKVWKSNRKSYYWLCKTTYKIYYSAYRYIYTSLNELFLPDWLTKFPQRAKEHLKLKPKARHETPSFELLVRAVQEISKAYSLLLFPLLARRASWKHYAPQETKSSEDTEEELTKMSPPWAFMKTEAATQAFKGGKQPYQAMMPMNHNNDYMAQNSKDVLGEHIPWQQPTAH